MPREKVDAHRVRVPLVMLEGNLDVLLENDIPVNSISLKEIGPDGVVLTIHWSDEQREYARTLGFRTTTPPE